VNIPDPDYLERHKPRYARHPADAVLSRRVAERDRARHLAKHLFQMIDRDTWRATGGDDGQGHYEGDYRAASIEEEIRSWAT
jgi:hypothetical protein